MKLFRCDQIREIDEYTIVNEPVSSVDLMERAALQLFGWIKDKYPKQSKFVVFVGSGNNGGDGLALSRLLSCCGYEVSVYYIDFRGKISPDWQTNRLRLEKETSVKLNTLKEINRFPELKKGSIIIDAIFGSGLSRPLEGLLADIIQKINGSDSEVISIDIPSGLFGEDNSKNLNGVIVEADYTLSFQFPKLAFMFPENLKYTGDQVILTIGLHHDAIAKTYSPYFILDNSEVSPLLKSRSRFDHKGVFGHGLLIAGSYGKMGSAMLGAKAALRTGIGLLTCNVPSCGYQIIQTEVPEAMVITDEMPGFITSAINTETFSAVGVGPGIGTDPSTQKALFNLLSFCKKSIVIDADALNILSINKEWLSVLPKSSVLTPHPKEFERLAGSSSTSYERIEKQLNFSRINSCIVALKGSNTSISTPEGKLYFNSTGNPGMATGGSGDVLTGVILALLAQGYSSEDSAKVGVYLHGLAGDIAVCTESFESLIASDIISNIGNAFNKTRSH